MRWVHGSTMAAECMLLLNYHLRSQTPPLLDPPLLLHFQLQLQQLHLLHHHRLHHHHPRPHHHHRSHCHHHPHCCHHLHCHRQRVDSAVLGGRQSGLS